MNLSTKQGDGGRIAIIDAEKCKPKKCGLECKTFCPVNRADKVCVKVEKTSACSYIEETLCIGCGQCVKKCPFEAIKIIQLPHNLPNEISHRYGHNRFVLYKLPTPRIGGVLGLVGTNGIGKTTALNILTKRLQPNLGRLDDPPEWKDIIKHYKGSELQNYFVSLIEKDAKVAFKPQMVDIIPRNISGPVSKYVRGKDERKLADELIDVFQMRTIFERDVKDLSGGELQRFAIFIALIRDASIFIFDEPTSYLDIKQRLTISKAIRNYTLSEISNNYVILVEHDLSILDFLSETICCLFGTPGAFGVVSLPYSVKEGINVFLEGYLPKDNMRIRKEPLNFRKNEWNQDNKNGEEEDEESEGSEAEDKDKKPAEGENDKVESKKKKKKGKQESEGEEDKAEKKDLPEKKDHKKRKPEVEEEEGKPEKKEKTAEGAEDKKKKDKEAPKKGEKGQKGKKEADKKDKEEKKAEEPEQPANQLYTYPAFQKKFPGFTLNVRPGGFSTSQIIVLLGENGTGKTTFVKILAGIDKDIVGDPRSLPNLSISFKPQTITPKSTGTVQELFNEKIRNALQLEAFKMGVYDQMNLEVLLNNEVKKLSGGEMQRVGLVVALGKPADLYLIDEPSAYLDVEQRILVAKIIKRYIYAIKRTAFIVEHDFIMATYLADKFIVYEGEPGKECVANTPMGVVEGMNKFLSILGITFRRDAQNFRPRINKFNSQLDKEQKASGNYFFLEKQ